MSQIDHVFKALADPGRRQLLDRLFRENGQSLSSLCAEMQMSRQAVTQHLTILENANLVSSRKEGRERLHYINPVPIHDALERWIHKCEKQRLKALRDFKKNLERRHRHEQDKVRVRNVHRHHARQSVAGSR